jgi:hypothetical protein
MGTQQEGEMKNVVLFVAGGILICALLVVMGTYQGEAAADEGRDKSTLEKKVEEMQKKNRPSQATCPVMYYFDGPAYDGEDDCHNNGSTDCYAEWDPYGTHTPPGKCSNSGCITQPCNFASTADYLGQCFWTGFEWKAECRCHCWQDLK